MEPGVSRYRVKATGWTTGVQFPAGEIDAMSSLRHRVQTGPGAYPASYWKGTGEGALSPGRGADHSHLTSAEDKNAWIYTFTPPLRLHGVVLN
jgi:hypothetical protein